MNGVVVQGLLPQVAQRCVHISAVLCRQTVVDPGLYNLVVAMFLYSVLTWATHLIRIYYECKSARACRSYLRMWVLWVGLQNPRHV